VRWRWIWLLLALFALDSIVGVWWWYQKRDHRYDETILAASRRYGIEPALVKAVVWRESRFNARALGRHGEFGLMQVREPTVREWAAAEHYRLFHPQQLLDPDTNARAGAWYLSRLLQRYAQTDNPLAYTLADYNAGRSNVRQWNQGSAATNSAVFQAQIGFPGTQRYVQEVLQRYEHYRPLFPPSDRQ
jgi:soluble lytic murein transglycosylase